MVAHRPSPAASRLLVALLLCGLAPQGAARERSPAPEGWVWWEAEAPASTNFPAGNPFPARSDKLAQLLSGGRWIAASNPGQPLFLEYRVTIPRAGDFRFFARKFWQHGPFRWRFDDRPWTTAGPDVPMLDNVDLAKLVTVNWVDLGAVSLPAGPHQLRIELTETKGAAAFDAFLLTTGPFAPRGKLKPGERYPPAPSGWFAADPERDEFADSPIDLRGLNETFSGAAGFIQAKGAGFVHEQTGAPIRFWGVNAGHELLGRDSAAFNRYARRLAKHGVNLVRLHGPLWRADRPDQIDWAKLTKIHALVAALQREGIYLSLSLYFPEWLRPKNLPGLDGFDGERKGYGITFFNDAFQAMLKSWWRAALQTMNPFTGLKLAVDPTLAFVEIVNEESLLFWTFSPYEGLPAAQMAIVEKRFGSWLAARYGRLDAAFARWGRKSRGDDVGAGRAGFLPLWDIVGRRDVRAQDTAEFLATLQRTAFDEASRYLKRELGFKGNVIGSNWITADPKTLGPLDKWSNSGCDVVDRHGYYGGPHEGDGGSFALWPGSRYGDASALRFETGKRPGETTFDVPLADVTYDGRPSMLSELNWPMPNRFRTELPLLAAAYGSLQGTDAMVFFVSNDVEAPQALGKFSVGDPAVMGQFPAAALLFRQGLVRTAPPVMRVESRLADLFALRGYAAHLDPLAFLAGPVEVNVSREGGSSRTSDLGALIDRRRKVARSATGELKWNWQQGLVTLDAPAAQGAIGFLSAAGPIALGEMTLASPLAYGAVVLVPLDGRPIRTSRKLLLQVMSEDTNSGWSAPGDGVRPLVDPGAPPILVRTLAGRVTLSRPDAASLTVRPLDLNGYPAGPPRRGAADITLQPTTLYYLIEG
jgi:hypothetical protein